MSIKRFDRKSQRHMAMTHTVSYKNVPVPRGIAYALDLIDRKGATFDVVSCIRVDSILKQHNKQYGTNLHGQQYLYDNQNKPGFNPANPPSMTSHCYYSDGNAVYKRPSGGHASAGQKIVWYQIGIDTSDSDSVLKIGNSIGFHIVRPYSSGSEAHHLCFTVSPIKLLESKGTISKIRVP